MQLTPRQRRAERRSRHGNAVDMNLVSLIDVFTILIFFLLSNSGGVETLANPKAVQLPMSAAQTAPRDTVVVVVSATDIVVDGRKVAAVADVVDAAGVRKDTRAAALMMRSSGARRRTHRRSWRWRWWP